MKLQTALELAVLDELIKNGQNRTQAAKALGIGMRTLQRHIQKIGLLPGERGSRRSQLWIDAQNELCVSEIMKRRTPCIEE